MKDISNCWECIHFSLGGLDPGLLIFGAYSLVFFKGLHCPGRSCWLSKLSFLGQSFQAGRHAIPRLSQLLWVLWEIYRFLLQISHFPADTRAYSPCSKSLLTHFISPFSSFLARLLLLLFLHFSLSLCCRHFHLDISLIITTSHLWWYTGSPNFIFLHLSSINITILSERTTFRVTPPGIHLSPRKSDKTFLSNTSCSFPLKHFSAEAAKWLHNIILYKAGRNVTSEHLCLTLCCPFCTGCKGAWITISGTSIPFKQLGSVSPFRCWLYIFLCCSSVLCPHLPPLKTNHRDYIHGYHLPLAYGSGSGYRRH